jgi:tripartite-type tricarboxylate transporter receptor subunit TctC
MSMTSGRRRFLLTAAAALAAPVAGMPVVTRAQPPQRPLRVVVPYTPGGSADIMARALGAHLAARSGRTVIVENKPGATGAIGAQAVARSAPNGETILQSDIGPMAIQLAAGRPGYAASDFLPVARLVTDPIVLATRADSPLTSLAEVVKKAKADPGGLSYATPGILSHLHVAMERFAQLAGIELNHIPYQGTGPGVVAVLAGQVDLVALPPTTLQDQSAQLRPIAVATEAPLPELPGTPTFRASGFDLVLLGWRGLFAPKGTPAPVVSSLERAVLDAFDDAGFLEQIRKLGLTPAPLGAEAFASFWAADREAVKQMVSGLPRK